MFQILFTVLQDVSFRSPLYPLLAQVVVNAQLKDMKEWTRISGRTLLFDGAFEDVLPSWYETVGVGICVQVLTSAVLASLEPLIQSRITAFQIRREGRALSFHTQAAYDELCSLQTFDLAPQPTPF